MAIRTILVPTDFSTHSSVALDRAVELARVLGARLVLLHSYWISASVTPDIADPEHVLPATAARYFSPVLMVIFQGSIVAAILSTVEPLESKVLRMCSSNWPAVAFSRSISVKKLG